MAAIFDGIYLYHMRILNLGILQGEFVYLPRLADVQFVHVLTEPLHLFSTMFKIEQNALLSTDSVGEPRSHRMHPDRSRSGAVHLTGDDTSR